VRRFGAAASVPVPIPGVSAPGVADRALVALREIAHAVLTAERVEDALQFALERVSPVVGSSFASVYLAEGESDLLKLVAAYNWPEKWRPWLGEMRVRMGFGPSGEAASERRTIEVPDVFADPALEDWQEVAQELGFQALIALPLSAGMRVLGVATFYFADGGGFTSAQRDLLRVASDQMSLAAMLSELAERARRAGSRLADAESEAERQAVAAIEARRARDEFLSNVSHELKTPLTIVLGTIELLTEELGGPLTPGQRSDLTGAKDASERLLGVVETLLALSALRRGTLEVVRDEFDPRLPMRDAIIAAGEPPAGVELVIEEPSTFVPSMRGDREKTSRILISLLANAYKFAPIGRVTASVAVAHGRVQYRVKDSGVGIPPGASAMVFDEFRQGDSSVTRRHGGAGLGLALARGLARLLGGDIELVSELGEGATFSVELPLETA
jgi:signal transduction histidine kinase